MRPSTPCLGMAASWRRRLSSKPQSVFREECPQLYGGGGEDEEVADGGPLHLPYSSPFLSLSHALLRQLFSPEINRGFSDPKGKTE